MRARVLLARTIEGRATWGPRQPSPSLRKTAAFTVSRVGAPFRRPRVSIGEVKISTEMTPVSCYSGGIWRNGSREGLERRAGNVDAGRDCPGLNRRKDVRPHCAEALNQCECIVGEEEKWPGPPAGATAGFFAQKDFRVHFREGLKRLVRRVGAECGCRGVETPKRCSGSLGECVRGTREYCWQGGLMAGPPRGRDGRLLRPKKLSRALFFALVHLPGDQELWATWWKLKRR